MPTTVLPLGQRILVKPDAAASELRGIELPERVKDRMRPESGEIVAVSIDLVDEFSIGERVCFAPYSGVELAVDGEPRIVLGKAEVLGRIGDAAVA